MTHLMSFPQRNVLVVNIIMCRVHAFLFCRIGNNLFSIYVVLYAANINIGLDMTTAASREELWKKLKPSPNCNMMNVPLPWYPEQKDYAVCSIKHGKLILCEILLISYVSRLVITLNYYVHVLGGMTLLEYNEETGFMVHQDKSGLSSVTVVSL